MTTDVNRLLVVLTLPVTVGVGFIVLIAPDIEETVLGTWASPDGHYVLVAVECDGGATTPFEGFLILRSTRWHERDAQLYWTRRHGEIDARRLAPDHMVVNIGSDGPPPMRRRLREIFVEVLP